MVGDRLYTDIALGETGMLTVLVLSGETDKEDLPAAVHQPDYVMQDLAELTHVLSLI
jgi:ribonucleotide monophosphatase NagD (HAD superfamily)